MADEQNDRVRELTFSSETVVSRWYGGEILDHAASSVRMGFISSGRAPMLMHHDHTNVIGVVQRAFIKNRQGHAEVRFGRTQAANDALTNVDDDIITNVSVGYRLYAMRLESTDDKGNDVYRITDWEPNEVSPVGVPADPTVGFKRSSNSNRSSDATIQNRAASTTQTQTAPVIAATERKTTVPQETAAAGANADSNQQERDAQSRVDAGRQQQNENFAVEQEKTRVTAIRNLGKSAQIGEDTIQAWITRGCTLDQVATDILQVTEARGKTSPQSVSVLGLSDREAGEYSLCRAILAARDQNWKNAGFELRCHQEIANRTDKPQQAHTFYVPLEVQRRMTQTNIAAVASMLERRQMGYAVRDLTTAQFTAGGALVQTTAMGFDELLRNLAFAFRMGATRLTGLRDNVTIPRQTAAASAEWLPTEASGATESQPSFTQLAMSPKTVSAYTELSRKLLLQSSIDVEGLVNADLAAVCALAVDSAVLKGTGASGQPLGLDNVTGVGTVSGSSLGLAGLLETQTDLANSNIRPLRPGYVTTPDVAALMIAEVLYANTASPAWIGNVWEGTMMGVPAMSTNQVSAARMYFGGWENCIVGEWGVLEIDTNPYANFGAGIIGVRAMYSVDVAIRRPAAFTIVSSIT
jgi:HK97 family phage major capsid protein